MGDDSTRPPATGYPVANGYPYPNPHPPPPNPYFYANQAPPPPYYDHNLQQRQLFMRRVITGMLACFILIGAILLITWAVIRPQFPTFQITSASLSNFNLTSTSISGLWDFNVTVSNPNKKVTIKYEAVEASVGHQSTREFADNVLAPFVQGVRSETVIRVSVRAEAYLDGKELEVVRRDRAEDGVVGFEVRVWARAYFDVGVWRMRRRYIRVLCQGVEIRVPEGSSTGNMTGGPKGCRVGW